MVNWRQNIFRNRLKQGRMSSDCEMTRKKNKWNAVWNAVALKTTNKIFAGGKSNHCGELCGE